MLGCPEHVRGTVVSINVCRDKIDRNVILDDMR